MSYIQGFLIPVPEAKKQAYLDLATSTADMFREFGAERIVETWGVDVPEGKTTDFLKAVKAEPGEAVVFSWIVWPDKATCDAAAKRMETDERMQPGPDMPFDGRRMIYGGFEPIFDTGA